MSETYIVQTIYELIVLIGGIIFLVMIYQRYIEKKNDITLTLMKMYGSMSLGILFSLLGKIYLAYFEGELLNPSIEGFWFYSRLVRNRFPLVFIIYGSYQSRILYMQVFDKQVSKKKLTIFLSLLILIEIYLIFVFDWDSVLLDVIGFLFVALYNCIVYIPFMIKSFQLAMKMEDKIYQKAIKSLGYMAIAFVFVLVNFFINRSITLITGEKFSLFYYLAWLCVLLAIFFGYFGYIKPKSRQ